MRDTGASTCAYGLVLAVRASGGIQSALVAGRREVLVPSVAYLLI